MAGHFVRVDRSNRYFLPCAVESLLSSCWMTQRSKLLLCLLQVPATERQRMSSPFVLLSALAMNA